MRKFILLLFILSLGFLGYTYREYTIMHDAHQIYENSRNNYEEVLREYDENEIIISELKEELGGIVHPDYSSNKEYMIWKRLCEKVEDLLQ